MYIQQFEVDTKEAPDIFYGPVLRRPPAACDGEPEHRRCHDWNVWHGQPFHLFPEYVPALNSEFGLQSFPCLKTIESFTRPEDRNIFSCDGRSSEEKKANEVINYYVPGISNFKKISKRFSICQTIQLGGNPFTAWSTEKKPERQKSVWTLFWQLNDCWPGGILGQCGLFRPLEGSSVWSPPLL